MFSHEYAIAGVRAALAQRGFAWPEKGVKDKDSVTARLLAFDALRNLTGLSPTAIARAVNSTASNAKAMGARCERCYRTVEDRAEWVQLVRACIERHLAGDKVA